MSKINIIIIMLFIPIVLLGQDFSYIITGIVYDENHQEMPGAYVMLSQKGSAEVFKGINASDGFFKFEGVPSGEYIIRTEPLGYNGTEKSIAVTDKDISDIELFLEIQPDMKLSEIVITANTIEKFADKTTFRLSGSDRNSFSNALTVLHTIPKLQVSDLSVSTTSGKAVKILINGINADEADLSVISSQDILRIEYYANPPLRFATVGLGAVVNVITKKSNSGGSIALNTQNAFTTGYGNDVVNFKYGFGNSQIGVKYNINYRNNDKRVLDENIAYEFGGVSYKKEKNGLNGPYRYEDQLVEISFNNTKADDYVFSSKVHIKNYNHKREADQEIMQILPDQLKMMGHSSDRDKNLSPNIDLYFNKIFNLKHEVLLNFVGTYFDSHYNYDYSETLNSVTNFKTATNIEGDKYSFIGDFLYGYNLINNKISIGAKYLYGLSRQNMITDNNLHTNSRNDEVIAYGEFQGKVRRLSYKISVGVDYSRFKSETLEKDYNFTALKPLLSFTYALNKESDISLSYQMNTINPTLAELSPSLYMIDYKYAYSGNPDLKPYNQHDFLLSYYLSKEYIQFSSDISISYAKNPILTFFTENDKYILETLDNLKNNKEYKWSFDMDWFPFTSKIIRLGLYGELFHSSNSFSDINWTYNGFRVIPSMIINYKRWNLMALYLSKSKRLLG